jgi:hypothetical protein
MIKTNLDYTEIELLKIFYDLVPLHEDSKGLKYPEIMLSINKNKNESSSLQINFPLKICSDLYGLVTYNTSFNDYFKYNFKSDNFYYKGLTMSLTFSKDGIIFECCDYNLGIANPKYYKFRFHYNNIEKVKDFISNQGKYISKCFNNEGIK